MAVTAKANNAETSRRTGVAETGETSAQYFWQKVEERGDAVALRHKHRGIWKPTSWREFGDNSRLVGLGLMALGVRRGEAVALISDGGPSWLFADRGIQGIGAVCVAIHTTDDAARMFGILADCKASVCIVENAEQLQKLLELRHRLSKWCKLVVINCEGLYSFRDPQVISFKELGELGRQEAARHPQAWKRELAAGHPADPAVVAYSLAGDGGAPRGVVLTQANLMFMVHNVPALLAKSVEQIQLSLLPLANVTERVLTTLVPLHTGAILNVAESSDTIDENLREVQPTHLFCTPRRLELAHSRQAVKMARATVLGRWAYRAALSIGERAARRRAAGASDGGWAFRLADLLVLRNVKRVHGLSRVKLVLVGGGLLAQSICAWFAALGIDVRPIYGLSESTGIAAMPAAQSCEVGRVGQALPGTEMVLAPNGEILLRGPHVSPGYWGQPPVIRKDDWLRTGDLGDLDAEGAHTVIGRMADQITLEGGLTVSPAHIEALLCASPYIAAAILVGDGQPTVGALILPDHESVVQYAQKLNVPFTNFASLCATAEVRQLIQSEIGKTNALLPSDLAIDSFGLLNRAFAPDDAEIAKGIRLNRAALKRSFNELIDGMRAAR